MNESTSGQADLKLWRKVFRDVPFPDLIFDAALLDSVWRNEVEEGLPLHESRDSNQHLPGCYAFAEVSQAPFQIMYVGKAVRLRNRLVTHWGKGSPFLERWANDAKVDHFCPFVAVWFTDDRAAMEAELINRLHPRYNLRHE